MNREKKQWFLPYGRHGRLAALFYLSLTCLLCARIACAGWPYITLQQKIEGSWVSDRFFKGRELTFQENEVIVQDRSVVYFQYKIIGKDAISFTLASDPHTPPRVFRVKFESRPPTRMFWILEQGEASQVYSTFTRPE